MSDRDFPLPDHHDPHPERPGSAGEHVLQDAMGTGARAERFLSDQMSDRLVPSMQEFIARMTMAFVATADAHGECDSTLRAGPPGFLRVLDDRASRGRSTAATASWRASATSPRTRTSGS